MALYLDEVWVKDPTPERVKAFVRLIGTAAKVPTSLGVPQGVHQVAGPWMSNEEPKAIFIVEIPDHTPTFQLFGRHMAGGLIERRRLTPIVEWDAVEKMVEQL